MNNEWVIPSADALYFTAKEQGYYVMKEDYLEIGKSTVLALSLIPSKTATSGLLWTSVDNNMLKDLGNYRLLTCHDSTSTIRIYANLTYNYTQTFAPGCYIHNNVIKIDAFNHTALTHVSYITNHTFGLHSFMKMNHDDEDTYKAIKEQIKAHDRIFTQNEKVLLKLHDELAQNLHKAKEDIEQTHIFIDKTLLTRKPNMLSTPTDCMLFNLFRRAVLLDFTCIVRWNLIHWIKEIGFWIVMLILFSITCKILVSCRKK